MANRNSKLKTRLVFLRIVAIIVLALVMMPLKIASGSNTDQFIVLIILAALLNAVFFDKYLVQFARKTLK